MHKQHSWLHVVQIVPARSKSNYNIWNVGNPYDVDRSVIHAKNISLDCIATNRRSEVHENFPFKCEKSTFVSFSLFPQLITRTVPAPVILHCVFASSINIRDAIMENFKEILYKNIRESVLLLHSVPAKSKANKNLFHT